MHHIAQILSWTLTASIHYILVRAKGLSWNNLFEAVETPKSTEEAYSDKIGGVCVLCNVSLLAWAFIKTSWYLALAYPIAGMILSVIVVEILDPVAVVKYGWYVPVLGNGYLWFTTFL